MFVRSKSTGAGQTISHTRQGVGTQAEPQHDYISYTYTQPASQPANQRYMLGADISLDNRRMSGHAALCCAVLLYTLSFQ